MSKFFREDTKPLQLQYPSEQRPSTTTLNTEYHHIPHHPAKLVPRHQYTNPEDIRVIRQAPLVLSVERKGLVESQPSKEATEVIYTTTDPYAGAKDERRHRRHQSERILPSVEVEEHEGKGAAQAAREDSLRIAPVPYQQSATHSRPRYVLDSGRETHILDDHANLKRARDDQDVYFVEERPRRSFPFDGSDRVVHTTSDDRPPKELLHHRAKEQTFDKAPVFVEYRPKVVQVPPRAREIIPNLERQVYSVPQSNPNGRERTVHFGQQHEQENAIPRETRRASYAQSVQQPVLIADPRRPHDASSIYSTTLRDAATVQPPLSRIICIDDDDGDSRSLPPAGQLHRNPQFYDERGRPVEDDGVVFRREAVVYASARR